MTGMRKIFLKDLFELYHRPYMLLWLVIVPLFLLYLAGHTSIGEPQVRLLFHPHEDAQPDSTTVRGLLEEFSNIVVIERDGGATDTLTAMESERADLALVWQGQWQIYQRSSSRQKREQLSLLGSRIGFSVLQKKPFMLSLLGSRLKRINKINFSLVSFHPPIRRNETSLVPAVIALIVAFLPFLLACGTFIRERETGTLEILLVSPQVAWMNMIVGKALIPLFLAVTNFFILLLFSETLFDIHVKSGLLETFSIQLLAMLASTLLGLAASAIVRSELQAYLISALYLMCLILLTGFIYPIDQAMPLVQIVSRLFPLTFSQEPLATWMLQGTNAFVFKEEGAWLVAQCSVFFALASVSFFAVRQRI